MSSSESRTEMMKPLVIKAAIPVALSAAAYICAKIISKRSNYSQQTLLLPENDSFHSLNSTSLEPPESEIDPDFEDQGGANLENGQQSNLEDKLLELEIQLEELQKREWDSEARFLRYQSLKEREFMLTELRNLMMLEKTQAEFLLKEISMMEEENKRIGELVIEYSKLMQQIQSLKRENGFLQRKARKHWRTAKQMLRVLRKEKLGIEARDVELLRNCEKIQRQDNLVQELEDEVAELKGVVDHLQREKIELFNKVELDQKTSDSSNSEIETGVTKEEYEKVLRELQQLKKEREEEAKDLTYLKWSNACLRHELLRHHEQAKGENIHDWNGTHEEEVAQCNCVDDTTTGHVSHSRRRRLVQKFKRWVEGGGKIEEREKSEIKCLGWHSVPEEVEGQFVPSRNSCSSV